MKKAVLAGTMARTALFDSGLSGVEAPGKSCSVLADRLGSKGLLVLLVTHSKSEESGAVYGPMVASHMLEHPGFVHVETTGMFYQECGVTCPPPVAGVLESLGFSHRVAQPVAPRVWEDNGTVYRRLTATEPGDFVMVNGIFIGHAVASEVVISARDGIILGATGVDIKDHGLEKLQRLGKVNLSRAKVTSTGALRSFDGQPRITTATGTGVAFIDHAGRDVFKLAENSAGAVTVGDDTTAIVGDILRRFNIPVVGITDNDSDQLHPHGSFAPGSAILVVPNDDEAGLRVHAEIFARRNHTEKDFTSIKRQTLELLAEEVLELEEY